MNSIQIEANVQKLLQNFNKDAFIYDLLLAYGLAKANVTLLQKGSANLSKVAGEIEWRKKLFFKVLSKEEDGQKLLDTLKTHKAAIRNDPRFIIVTDFETLWALDTKTKETLAIALFDIAKYYDFFLPWAGMEKAQVQIENPADVKAAEKMGKLYAEIKKDNPLETPENGHSLNIFLSRLLFCFFAEDTGIFSKDIFTHAIESHTQQDGSDLNAYLDRLFEVLNTPPSYKNDLPDYLTKFPYVNGGLFRHPHKAPVFSSKSRKIIIECGGEDWSAINPDIFGSMIQAVVSTEQRGGLGMHYTSVPNIMKVIEPLFLNDLYEAFDAAKGHIKKLKELLQRLWLIKIFDPACGSGNFLIIAYKEMRKLEMSIFKEIDDLNKTYSNQFSGIPLNNFYGIEIDDFAHEIAILSLWLAEHQMNQAFFKAFKREKPALPLTETGNIVHGNATRLEWAEVCPHTEGGEVFVLGNPPYLGARVQEEYQKEDMALVFKGIKGFNNLDYIACWFYKASNYILNKNAQYAFVSTNSICQGEQVALLWQHLLKETIEIAFAYKSFKWVNNAKYNAGVTVAIIGLRNKSNKLKFIYNSNVKQVAENINSYLVNARNVFIEKESTPISKLPEMCFGSMPNDGGHLILNLDDYKTVISLYPEASKFIKILRGSQEFINEIPRWCIWINDEDIDEASRFSFIKDRIEKVKKHRSNSERKATNALSNIAHRFAEIRYKTTDSIIVPSVSSERREYIPIGFLDNNTIISNAANAIYDAELFIFSILNSRMHMTWVRAVCGRLKTDYRYSSSLVYNTFPIPPLSIEQKQAFELHVFNILDERDKHTLEKTLADLYDPDKMPDGLREAHRLNDVAVERLYRSKPFESDEERLAHLFKLYEQMIADEKTKGTLFETEKKEKKMKKKN